MDFIKRSDIGTWDWLDNGWYLTFFVVAILVCVGLIVVAIICFASTDEDKYLTIPFGLLMLMVGLSAPFITFSIGTTNESNKARDSNISQVFNVDEDQKYYAKTKPKEGMFADFETTIKDAEAQTIREVTFGFKESGEPFIYETGEVNKEFIEGLKK